MTSFDKYIRVYKKPRSAFRSLLMKTLDWSVETFDRECNSTGLLRSFLKSKSSERNMTDIIRTIRTNFIQTKVLHAIENCCYGNQSIMLNRIFFSVVKKSVDDAL